MSRYSMAGWLGDKAGAGFYFLLAALIMYRYFEVSRIIFVVYMSVRPSNCLFRACC